MLLGGVIMSKGEEYFLVRSDILPEVFVKVMQVKRLLNSGKARSINEAVQVIGISRSAYYKYKDSIMPFYETSKGKIVTLTVSVENFPGILAGIIQCIAFAKGNILTINQNIPINGLADISISMETDRMSRSIDLLVTDVQKIPGVRSCRIMARE